VKNGALWGVGAARAAALYQVAEGSSRSVVDRYNGTEAGSCTGPLLSVAGLLFYVATATVAQGLTHGTSQQSSAEASVPDYARTQ